MTAEEIGAALAQAFADEWGRVVASLVRTTGDWALAEDAAQEAFATAATSWVRDGVPRRPGAWLTTVARNRALDRIRRGSTERSALAALQVEGGTMDTVEPDDVPDDRLRLIFTCCHPALQLEARVALTLRTLCGLTVEEIAHAFGVSEAATAKRLVRARQKIQRAGIPYRVPSGAALPERLTGVLGVLYLLFTEGYAPSSGRAVVRPELSGEAIRLTTVLADLMPEEPEVLALLALEHFQDSRRLARTGADGSLVPLDEQDRRLWSPESIAAGERALTAAERLHGDPGPILRQARIAGFHARSLATGRTDLAAIAREYDGLVRMSPSPHLALARAVAVGLADGPEAGLVLLAELEAAGALAGESSLPAARADLLRRAGRLPESAEAYRAALALVRTEPERGFLERRLGEVEHAGRQPSRSRAR
jgi:RNA polymerase sigma-70 factor (ECF subfamily)